jgi:peptidoglycan hydrolase CwlO-like protein
MTPKERFDAAAQAHHDMLQGILNENKTTIDLRAQLADLQSQVEKGKADYDQLLTNMASYLESWNATMQPAQAAEPNTQPALAAPAPAADAAQPAQTAAQPAQA